MKYVNQLKKLLLLIIIVQINIKSIKNTILKIMMIKIFYNNKDLMQYKEILIAKINLIIKDLHN